MIDSELPMLSKLLDSARRTIEPLKEHKPIAAAVVKTYFELLNEYSFEQVAGGLKAHLKGPSGQYFPKPADIIRHIHGSEITADEIVAAAKIHKTPLGILARIHIGTWDLNNMDGFYLRQRAQEVLQLLPEWKARALEGKYTEHEISIMLKHKVNPVQPFSNGLQPPRNRGALAKYARYISETPRHKMLLEAPYRGDNEKNPKIPENLKLTLEEISK